MLMPHNKGKTHMPACPPVLPVIMLHIAGMSCLNQNAKGRQAERMPGHTKREEQWRCHMHKWEGAYIHRTSQLQKNVVGRKVGWGGVGQAKARGTKQGQEEGMVAC